MRFPPRLAMALALPALTTAATAQAPARFAARVDSLVTAEVARQQLVGVSVLVAERGRVVLERGYGLANVEHRVAATPATIYQSGSLGKQFTAGLVLLLVEEGRLRLEDSVPRFFPGAPAGWGAVTIRHLLTHTSGAGDYPDDFDFRHDWTEAELRDLILSRPFAFPPGSQWAYSNLGYALLGLIVREVTGRFYGDVLAERIFHPLGMVTARVISEAAIVPNRAAGYRRVAGELQHQEWVAPMVNTTADGSLYLSVRDMARWDAALHGGRLFRPETMAAIRTAVRLTDGSTRPYGFGWGVGRSGPHAVMAHGGAWQGFRTHIVRYPEVGLTVVVFANVAGADPGVIAYGIASLWNPELGALAE